MIARTIAAKLVPPARNGLHRVRETLNDLVIESWSGVPSDHFEIDPTVDIRNHYQVAFKAGLVIKAGTILNGRSTSHSTGLELGGDVYIKEHCILDAYGGRILIEGPAGIAQRMFVHGGGGVEIGRYFIAGPGCSVIASNHRTSSSLAPFMLQGDRRKGISIGSNVWLGANVTVLDGSIIGSNVVVGAGTVVSGTIPSGSLVYGDRRHAVRPMTFSEAADLS